MVLRAWTDGKHNILWKCKEDTIEVSDGTGYVLILTATDAASILAACHYKNTCPNLLQNMTFTYITNDDLQKTVHVYFSEGFGSVEIMVDIPRYFTKQVVSSRTIGWVPKEHWQSALLLALQIMDRKPQEQTRLQIISEIDPPQNME